MHPTTAHDVLRKINEKRAIHRYSQDAFLKMSRILKTAQTLRAKYIAHGQISQIKTDYLQIRKINLISNFSQTLTPQNERHIDLSS